MFIFGYIGMVLVQGSAILQIITFIKEKKTAGVSIGFWWVILTGLICYLLYAIHIQDILYIISNSIGIVLTTASIILYYYYKKNYA